MTGLHPVECPCGWAGKPQAREWRARARLRDHQTTKSCPMPSPVPPTACTALSGSCACQVCRTADSDRVSPLDLGGRWVSNGRGTRVWSPA